MHCGADLGGYKVEITPKIEVAPKISVSAKAEGGLALKWKKKPEKYLDVKEYGKLPVFRDYVKLDDKPFCPLCGNYDCLELKKEEIVQGINLYFCQSCRKYLCSSKLMIKDIYHSREEIEEIIHQTRKEQEREQLCKFCGYAVGIYTCSVCGKRICESCVVTNVVKTGLFSKETIKMCPICAKGNK